MTNKKVVAAVLGVMCFLLTLGIFVQIKTVKNNNSTVSNNYEENSLRAEVLKYKEKYDNKYKELEKAEEKLEQERESSTKNDGELQSKEEEITEGNKITGLTEVTGAGVIVTLTDSKKDISSSLNPSDLIVHDLDVLSVINELKNAGAEAISINDERITNSTSITCDGNVVLVNGNKISSPFVIKAIGSQEALLGAIKRPGGFLEELEQYGLVSSVKKQSKITINKYSGIIDYKYIRK